LPPASSYPDIVVDRSIRRAPRLTFTGLRGALSAHAAAPVKPIRRRMMSLMF